MCLRFSQWRGSLLPSHRPRCPLTLATKQTGTKRVFKSHDQMARYEFLSTSSSTSVLAQTHVFPLPPWPMTLPLLPCPTLCTHLHHRQVVKGKSTRTRTLPTPRHPVPCPQNPWSSLKLTPSNHGCFSWAWCPPVNLIGLPESESWLIWYPDFRLSHFRSNPLNISFSDLPLQSDRIPHSSWLKLRLYTSSPNSGTKCYSRLRKRNCGGMRKGTYGRELLKHCLQNDARVPRPYIPRYVPT